MTTPVKPVSQDDTAAGQVVWMPKRIYRWLRRLAEAESRPVSRQLEVIITEWLESSLKQTEMISEDAPEPLGAFLRRLRQAEEEWKNPEPKERG